MYEAASGGEGLVGLTEAWHSRVMADDIVSHAFSHGFHPQHTDTCHRPSSRVLV